MNKSNNNKILLVTHNGSFHSDDIFACATISLLLEKEGKDFEVVRTRDEETIRSGDYVFDVGGVYDKSADRFDHHQVEGAGKHENGIEYASFGLVWEKFGQELCGSADAAKNIESKLVCAIDAGDNGVDLVVEFKHETKPYFLQYAFNAFTPTWKNVNDESLYASFMECVEIAKKILAKEIAQSKDAIEARDRVLELYNQAEDKRIIILDKKYPYEETLSQFPEPLFVIYPRVDGAWGVKAQKEDHKTFKNKKDFPSGWAGLRDAELEKVTGVDGAMFCHRALFLVVAKTKEGAIKLAQIALES